MTFDPRLHSPARMKKLFMLTVFAVMLAAVPCNAQSNTTLPNGCNTAYQSCDYSAAISGCATVLGPGDAYAWMMTPWSPFIAFAGWLIENGWWPQ